MAGVCDAQAHRRSSAGEGPAASQGPSWESAAGCPGWCEGRVSRWLRLP